MANPRREQSLEGDAHQPEGTLGQPGVQQAGEPTPGRGPASKEVTALRGEKALKENPKSVTGMKQGRKVSEDVSRQEGEKP